MGPIGLHWHSTWSLMEHPYLWKECITAWTWIHECDGCSPDMMDWLLNCPYTGAWWENELKVLGKWLALTPQLLLLLLTERGFCSACSSANARLDVAMFGEGFVLATSGDISCFRQSGRGCRGSEVGDSQWAGRWENENKENDEEWVKWWKWTNAWVDSRCWCVCVVMVSIRVKGLVSPVTMA